MRSQLKHGAKLVVIDPRRIDITRHADLWLKPRPGSDPVLAFGLLKVTIEEGLYDKDFVENWTVGFDEIREHVKTFSLDEVERMTWIAKKDIQQVARWYYELQPANLGSGMGSFGQGARSFQGMRVANILRAIVAHESLPGWGVTGTRPPYTPGGKIYLLDKLPRKLEGNVAAQHKYAVRTSYIPGVSLVNGILDGKIKAAIFTQCEPLISYPDSHKTYEAFKKLELLVVLNIFMTPTTALADIVLPAATTNECETINCFTGTQMLRAIPKIVEPPGEARSDVMILNDLAKRMGLGEYFFDSDVETINYVLGPSGLTWEEMKKKRLLEGTREKKAEEGGYFTTPSGKMEIVSSRAKEVYNTEPLPLWKHMLPFWEPSDEYPLLMTSFADEEFHLAAYKHIKRFRQFKPYPTVQLNPEVAAKIGAKEGDWVWIESKQGRIMQKLNIDPELDPRVVMCTYGWFFPEDPSNCCQYDKANVNVLLPDNPVEIASGAQDTRGVPCRVYKADPSEVNLPQYIEGVHAV